MANQILLILIPLVFGIGFGLGIVILLGKVEDGKIIKILGSIVLMGLVIITILFGVLIYAL